MNFLIITQAEHKINPQNILGGYAPYIKEMNLWAKYVDTITLIGPIDYEPFSPIDIALQHTNVQLVPVAAFNFKTIGQAAKSILRLPGICLKVYTQMRKADHIHLRCPGNMGLVGCFVQFFFPKTKKTAKYAGNWDWASKQPKSYRLQQYLLRNTWFTKNMQVLVYGHWPDQNRNMLPFFTASYTEADLLPVSERTIGKDQPIKLIYVGAFAKGKQPLLSVKSAGHLLSEGFQVELNMFGDGAEMPAVKQYIEANPELKTVVHLHGNKPAALVKECFIKSHFLVFVSRSEGWPKVVAESMFWGCVPITTAVSCVPEMVGQGSRGSLVAANETAITNAIKTYLQAPETYLKASSEGMKWSRQFTLEKMEKEIAKLL